MVQILGINASGGGFVKRMGLQGTLGVTLVSSIRTAASVAPENIVVGGSRARLMSAYTSVCLYL